MADAFALIEINTEGNPRLKELSWLDFRLENICFEDTEGLNQLHSQLPDGMKDVLVLTVFDYVSNCTRDYWGEYDCEELFNIISFQVVKEGHKEFYREMVTEYLNLGIYGFENLNAVVDADSEDRDYCKELVSDWEEFYDEDFVPYEKKPAPICGIEDFWKV